MFPSASFRWCRAYSIVLKIVVIHIGILYNICILFYAYIAYYIEVYKITLYCESILLILYNMFCFSKLYSLIESLHSS